MAGRIRDVQVGSALVGRWFDLLNRDSQTRFSSYSGSILLSGDIAEPPPLGASAPGGGGFYAWDIDTDGKPVFLGLEAASSESGDAWKDSWPGWVNAG